MSVLSWGHCGIQYCPSVDGAPDGNWVDLEDTPKEDTTKLTASQGTEKSATEEGGAIVDYLPAANTYDFEYDHFVKKGKTAPFSDTDGVVDGEWAFRVIPQDKACYGIQIDRAVVRVDVSYAAADGILLHHAVKCLKPAEGNTIKPYQPSEDTVLDTFAGAATASETTGDTEAADGEAGN